MSERRRVAVIAEQFNIKGATVRDIRSRRTWAWL